MADKSVFLTCCKWLTFILAASLCCYLAACLWSSRLHSSGLAVRGLGLTFGGRESFRLVDSLPAGLSKALFRISDLELDKGYCYHLVLQQILIDGQAYEVGKPSQMPRCALDIQDLRPGVVYFAVIGDGSACEIQLAKGNVSSIDLILERRAHGCR